MEPYFRLEQKPEHPPDFSKTHNTSYFDILWVEKYPDKPWDFKDIIFNPWYIFILTNDIPLDNKIF